MMPRSPAPIIPRSFCHPPCCPMEVRGVHGGLRAVWKDGDGAEEAVEMLCQRMHVQKGMWGYFWGELFPKSLHPSWHRSGSWGWAVFALHCRVLIGAVCPLLPRWRLLLGQVSKHCCKAVGVLLWQGIIVIQC